MASNNPYLLHEHEVDRDILRLDEAWNQPATFLYYADKSGVPTEWLEDRLSLLDNECRQNHFVLLTSGSTGKPKLVVGKRKRSEDLVSLLHKLQECEPVEEAVCLLPLTYCYSFINQWLWARQFKRRLRITEGLADPKQLKEILMTASQAMVCLVGAQVPLLVRHFPVESFGGVIRVHFAGGRFPQELLHEVQRLFPNAEVFNNYGCAEAMPRLTLRRAEVTPEASHIGWPLPGVQMRSDDYDRMLFRSVYGAIAIIDDDGFAAIDSEMWVPTGDLGRPLEDGQWEILGRANEVFKRFGEKISLPQILGLVRSHWEGHADCYREVDRQGEEGYTLVLSPVPSTEKARELLRLVSRSFPRTHWPLRVEGIPGMPLLPSGKIDRQGLSNHESATVVWRQRM
jgi:acyl-CoA synthetase (AMP-forming)/AMP-acid ligase II